MIVLGVTTPSSNPNSPMKGLIVDAGGYDPEITLLKKGA